MPTCSDCGKTFDTEDRLDNHRRTHESDSVELSLGRNHLIGGGVIAVIAVAAVFLFTGGQSGAIGAATTSDGTGTQPGMTAPDATFTTVNGKEVQLSDYKGEKVMLWFFATWCPSCKQGARSLQANNDQLQGMEIIAVKTAGNAGYSGPSVTQFVQSFAPSLLDAENWVWGTASRSATSTFNPQDRPDIYYLIDEDGTIQARTGAPAATINRITQFAQS